MDQRVSLITLGTADLDRSRGFYEALGWRCQLQVDGTAFFQCGGLIVSLWSRKLLAKQCTVEDDGHSWGGIGLAHNVGSQGEVDAVIAAARSAGARSTTEPAPTPWGGYAGTFLDPDGHAWEIAHNPGFTLTATGDVLLPEA